MTTSNWKYVAFQLSYTYWIVDLAWLIILDLRTIRANSKITNTILFVVDVCSSVCIFTYGCVILHAILFVGYCFWCVCVCVYLFFNASCFPFTLFLLCVSFSFYITCFNILLLSLLLFSSKLTKKIEMCETKKKPTIKLFFFSSMKCYRIKTAFYDFCVCEYEVVYVFGPYLVLFLYRFIFFFFFRNSNIPWMFCCLLFNLSTKLKYIFTCLSNLFHNLFPRIISV